MPDTSYNGLPLDMKLPLRVEGDEDCVHILDNSGKVIVEGLLNSTDAHYIVDAVNEYRMVRDAKIDAIGDVRKYIARLRGEEQTEFGEILLGQILENLAEQIQKLKS